MTTGRLFGIGLGPGDPELITLKAYKLIQQASVIAYPTAKAGHGNALRTAKPHLHDTHTLLPLVYPVTAGPEADQPDYLERMYRFYDETAEQMAQIMDKGEDIALLCAGDPFVYGSFMYWFKRLNERYETIIVPGISSIFAGAVAAQKPWVLRNDTLRVIPGTLSETDIISHLAQSDAVAIIKLGRTFAKVRNALEKAGKLDKAVYVERATMNNQKVMPVSAVKPEDVPYFSMIFIAGSDVG